MATVRPSRLSGRLSAERPVADGSSGRRQRTHGPGDPFVQWVAVRADTLLEGDASACSLHESLVSSLFKPARTTMASVANFMCDLVTNAETWDRWAGRMPVIVDEWRPNQ